MSKHQTLVQYKTGRIEIIHHKNGPDMERTRKRLASIPTVSTYRTPTKADLMEMRR